VNYFIFLIACLISSQCIASESSKKCTSFISQNQNYKKAHLNKNCQLAALDGNANIQYSVGMGYGFDGLHDLE